MTTATAESIVKLSHKDMTKHIRTRLKKSGVPCCIRLYKSCGKNWIRVSTKQYGQDWTSEQLKTLWIIATVNGLEMAGGQPIHEESIFVQLTGADFHFVYPR